MKRIACVNGRLDNSILLRKKTIVTTTARANKPDKTPRAVNASASDMNSIVQEALPSKYITQRLYSQWTEVSLLDIVNGSNDSQTSETVFQLHIFLAFNS